MERLAKPDERRSKQWCKCSGGDGQTPCHCEDGLPPNHHSVLCVKWKNMKIFEDLSNNKNMTFNVRMLLNIGGDHTLLQRVEKNQCGQNEQMVLWI